MKGTRLYKIVIALLVVMNLAMLLFMWFGKPPHPPRPGETPELSIKIGLTGEAKAKVDALEKQHHADKHILLEKDAELHKKMFALVGSGEPSDSIQAILSANKAEIERMTFEFFDQVATYCNDLQKKKLQSFIQQRLVHIGPPPPPPHN